MTDVHIDAVVSYFQSLQDRICDGLAALDGGAEFADDQWERGTGLGGGGRSRVLSEGQLFERAGVNFSRVTGRALPASATAATSIH